MIPDTALKHFDQLWDLFSRHMLKLRGSAFTVEPFRPLFTREFADDLTKETAKEQFREQLEKWGKIERDKHPRRVEKAILEDGSEITLTRPIDPEVRWSRRFITTSFYNLVCLGVNYVTIEQLIFEANRYRIDRSPDNVSRKAFGKLLGISPSFLLAEWGQDILLKAISSDDELFLKLISSRMNENVPAKRFETAKVWLATTLLWYLGGRDLPRKEFKWLLCQKGFISKRMTDASFRAMLSNLGLK